MHVSSACHFTENGLFPEAGCLPTSENTFSSEKTTSVYPAITAGVSVLIYARDVHYSGCAGKEIMMIYPLRLFLDYEHDYETKMSETIMIDLLAYM